MQTEALILAALHTAPRRYRMPPLPADGDMARSSDADTALAYAVEAARVAKQQGAPLPPGTRDLFTSALAARVRMDLSAEHGDATFQALVLRTLDAQVDEHARLAAQADSDRRLVRMATDRIAHPGKLRAMGAGELRDRLASLHGLAAAGSWTALRQAVEQLPADGSAADAHVLASARALLSSPALARLERGVDLLRTEGVRRYRGLLERRGLLAGTLAATARGRASARRGQRAEADTVRVFQDIVELLNRAQPSADRYRVVRAIRTPRALPAAEKAKGEWDVAIVRGADDAGGAEVVLLAEVKASPAAATPDLPRLVRGLRHLARAGAEASLVFPSADGDVRIRGESLRKLQPHGQTLPPRVIYCCWAADETKPPMLSAAGKALLLTEPESLAFACRLAQGGSPSPEDLGPVWDALTATPRLHAALHQYETAQAVREAMLHPEDLLSSFRTTLAGSPGT